LSWCSSGLGCRSQSFSPEDGDSTLLRNVGFYQSVHTAT
jgi:hypothetical protein